MFLNCFGRNKESKKEPRNPPPSIQTIDGLSGSQRRDTQPDSGSVAAPPLPQRRGESPRTSKDVERLNGTYQHSEKVPVSQSAASPTPKSRTVNDRPSRMPLATQLSRQELNTSVPISGNHSKRELPSPQLTRQDPIGEESGDDYVDPQKQHTTSPEPQIMPRDKPIASISDEKRTDIFSDYFTGKSDISVNVTTETDAEESEPCHDYTNMADIPDLDSARHRLSHASPKGSESVDMAIKSPRRPKPVPRLHDSSANSSRKHSLTSDSGDSAFNYENVNEVLTELPGKPGGSTRSGPHPSVPKPQPRTRSEHLPSSPNDGVESVASNLSRPIPSPTRSSPLIHHKQKEGYIMEADYVPPSNDLDSHHHSPNSQTINYSVDLHKPVPKNVQPNRLNKLQEYLPMDQSEQTQALVVPAKSRPSHQDKTYDLNLPIPPSAAKDIHSPGYITVIGDNPKPATSGTYYNISHQPDYLNTSISPANEKQPVKSRHHTGSSAEGHYFG